jgi:flavodoxin
MGALLIMYSYHQGNTEKIADCIARVLDAPVKTPWQVNPQELDQYDLIGFGSGIYSAKHHQSLLELADRLPQVNGKKAFLFSTDGMPRKFVKDQTALVKKMGSDHAALREKLQAKGYAVVGEFNCAGYNTNSFIKFFGGINKGRPDAKDLIDAAVFAQWLTDDGSGAAV